MRPRELFSIGEVAERTGIGVDTIRIWERRYGRPRAVRLPSGHRRYGTEEILWLRRVAEAIAAGHRPGRVVRAPEAELIRLIEIPSGRTAHSPFVRKALGWVREYRRADVAAALLEAWGSLSPHAFLAERLAPLVTAVGRAWADGGLHVRHEHFLSEVVEDVLRNLRSEMRAKPGKPHVVLTTLRGELHGLGLQMAALVCAWNGVPMSLLGTDTPNEEIVEAVAEVKARGVGVSVSLATGGVETDRSLAALRRALPIGVRVVVGGRGARGVRRGPRGVDYVESFPQFEAWLHSLESADGAEQRRPARS